MRRTVRSASVPYTDHLEPKAFKIALAPLLAFAIALAPLLATPRVSDDVINYSFRWLSGPAFLEALWQEIRHWALTSGRVFVVSLYMKDTIFKLFETALAYKAFLVAMNLACAAAFFAYVWAASRSRLLAVAALLALPFMIQLRAYHDPVVSFNGLFQLSAGLVFATLACHVQHARTGGRRWLLAAVACFVLNLLIYEMAAITVALVGVQDWALRRAMPKRYRLTLVLLLVFAAYFAVIVATRYIGSAWFGMQGTIYGLGLSPGAIAATFAKQILAVAPFSYALLRPPEGAWDVFALPVFPSWAASWQFAAALPAFALIAWGSLRLARAADERRGAAGDLWTLDARALALVAAGLLLAPAAVISMISRYQAEFGWGNGYSAVYLQAFGAALALALAISWFVRRYARARPWAQASLALLLGLASAGNLANNLAVARSLDQAWDPQNAWIATLRSPDLRALCGDVPLVIADPKPWTESRVVTHAGFRHLAMHDLRQAPPASGSFEVCVARSALLVGRNGTAFARVKHDSAARGLELRSPIHLVVPLEEGEARALLPLVAPCLAAPRHLALASEWVAAQRRYGLFLLEAPAGAVSHPAVIALPCE